MDNKMTAEQALETLVRACELEFTNHETESCEDAEPVASGMDGDSHITFGMIRGARKAIAALSAPRVPAVDDLARVLIEAWKKAEPDHAVTKHPVSYAATFADMARAAIDMLAASPEPVAPDAQQVIADLRAEVEALREALRPLARLDLRGDNMLSRPDDQPVYARDNTVITVGDVRRAAALLGEGGE